MSSESNDAAVLRDLAFAAVVPTPVPGTDGRKIVVAGQSVDLGDHFPGPPRIRAWVDALTMDGLLCYADGFTMDNARAYLAADTRNGAYCLSLCLDDDQPGSPSWRTHGVRFAARFDPAWEAWSGAQASRFTQETLGEFLLDHDDEIVSPTAADLLELVTNFSMTTTLRFASSRNLQNGLRSLMFHEENGTPVELRIPEQIEVGVPVYAGGEAFKMAVRIKYRQSDGEVLFSLARVRPERIVAQAQADLTSQFCDGIDTVVVVEGYAPNYSGSDPNRGSRLR